MLYIPVGGVRFDPVIGPTTPMMAPPRQRTAMALDDSRSEASSSTRERQGTAPKGRRPANPPVAVSATLSKEMKPSASTAPANADAEQSGILSGVRFGAFLRPQKTPALLPRGVNNLYARYDLTEMIARD